MRRVGGRVMYEQKWRIMMRGIKSNDENRAARGSVSFTRGNK